MSDASADHSSPLEVATFGGGCFWCLEAAFDQLKGVESVVSGYMGGHLANPTYEAVCMGNTGHAEVVQMTFDPNEISYHELLNIFFALHDPTTLNQQGSDVGTQYRSVIFYHSDQQKSAAEEVMRTLTHDQIFANPIVTQLAPATTFYPAEDYHQQYVLRNPSQPYCTFLIHPKLAKFRRQFSRYLKK